MEKEKKTEKQKQKNKADNNTRNLSWQIIWSCITSAPLHITPFLPSKHVNHKKIKIIWQAQRPSEPDTCCYRSSFSVTKDLEWWHILGDEFDKEGRAMGTAKSNPTDKLVYPSLWLAHSPFNHFKLFLVFVYFFNFNLFKSNMYNKCQCGI